MTTISEFNSATTGPDGKSFRPSVLFTTRACTNMLKLTSRSCIKLYDEKLLFEAENIIIDGNIYAIVEIRKYAVLHSIKSSCTLQEILISRMNITRRMAYMKLVRNALYCSRSASDYRTISISTASYVSKSTRLINIPPATSPIMLKNL